MTTTVEDIVQAAAAVPTITNIEKPPVRMLRVFKCRIPSCKFIFGDKDSGINGKPAVFVQGYYRTDNEEEIDQLEKEIRLGHPHIFVDPNEFEVRSDLIDPMAALRHKIIQEYLAEQAKAAGNPDRDMGTYVSGPVNPGNTQSLKALAPGSNSGGNPLAPSGSAATFQVPQSAKQAAVAPKV